uniref:Integrase catalytic domain-containing protein n=1 Tax=Oryzias sinensis TaxID=183150 RepID=A0A8C7YYB2_9TELE
MFFWNKDTYILVVDYFSRYIEVAKLNVTSAATVIAAMKETFSRHGIPETVVSDNGPQYASEKFKDFAMEYGFVHITSSPRYPQANGEAERAVATVKGLWKGGGEKTKALLSYRATPLECGYSPAQLLMGRQLKTTLPQQPVTLLPRWPNMKQFKTKQRQYKANQQRQYDRRHRVRPLTVLQTGQTVWLPREKKEGTVVQHATTPRSYIIDTDEGQIRRNRTHVRPLRSPERSELTVSTQQTGVEENAGRESSIPSNNTQDTVKPSYVTSSGRVSRPPKRLDL